ncbi:MAG: thiamine pyrophosphate-binding protein [Anaerolineae bacterium]|nr:thiamine pyrophosphate-binding protein [Anaerolineae bacterium]
MTTVAQLLAKTLYDRGVRTVFGLPGGEVVELLDAFRTTDIEFVLVKNESTAVYMADVTARLTGTIGVALTTLGPGAANAYAGVAHAYLDRAPVLLITAQTDPQRIGVHTHQVLDLQACFGPVTKFTAELELATAPETIQLALSQLTSGRPGPVHLGLCGRVASGETHALADIKQPPRTDDLASQVTAIKSWLNKSVRPVIVAGLGLEPEQPYAELLALAEALAAPVIDTPKAKGSVPANHPLFAGTLGLTVTDPAYEILDEADCIVAVGFDVVELVKPWSQTAPLIWIAPWQNYDPPLAAVHEYVGPMAPLLDALANRVAHRADAAWGSPRVADFRAKQAQKPIPPAAAGRITPPAVLAVIRDQTAAEVVITTDVGSHKIFTALDWPAYHPNRYFVSNGLSAMGFGLPAAIAAAKITQQPAICITGDAGLAMVIGELSLAVELNLPVVIVVMNDNALDLIRTAQQRRGKTVYGTTFTNPDYSLIVAGYGLHYQRVTDVPSCQNALQAALAAAGPSLLDVQIDPAAYPTAVNR